MLRICVASVNVKKLQPTASPLHCDIVYFKIERLYESKNEKLCAEGYHVKR